MASSSHSEGVGMASSSHSEGVGMASSAHSVDLDKNKQKTHGAQAVSEVDITPLVTRRPRKDLAMTVAAPPASGSLREDEPATRSGGSSLWADEPELASLPVPPPPPSGPFCILVVGASNSDEAKLSMEREVKVMEAQFTKEWGAESWRHVVQFKHFFYADMQELVQGLLDYKPVGVHFVCHGFKSALSLFDDLVSVETLAKALAAWGREDAFLRFVVANSCDSAALACALAEHVDFVIGHDKKVGDAAAVEFARVLYRALGAGYPMDTSFELAKATKGCSGYCLRGRKSPSKFSFAKPKPKLHDDQKLHDCVEVGVGHVDADLFAPRTALVEKLGGLLSAEGSKRVAVVGQGGSGKSTLVRGFLKAVSKNAAPLRSVRLVFFLQASDLRQGYRDLLRELCALVGDKAGEEEDDEKVRACVHALLCRPGVKHSWVGVLDDLPSPDGSGLEEHGLEWLLAPGAAGFPWGSGKTIVTSRFGAWMGPRVFQRGFEVRNLEVTEALGFLRSHVEHWREDEEGVAAVAHRLAYFPLALGSAVGCANEYALGASEYLRELDQSRSIILEQWRSRPRVEGEYPYELFEVVHATWQRLSEGADAVAVMALLRKLAFVDPCDVPIDMFGDLQAHLPVLKGHCLVSASPSASKAGPRLLVAIHALTQQVIREHLMGNARVQTRAAVVAALQAQMDTFDSDKSETFKVCSCRSYTAHVAAVMGHVEEFERVDGKAWGRTEQDDDLVGRESEARLAYATGNFLRTVTCAYADAKRMLERALVIRQRLAGGDESAGVADCYNVIGSICLSLGEFQEALEQYERALEIRTRVCGAEHLDSAKTQENIATVYLKQGKLEKSLEIYNLVMETKIKVLGVGLDVARTDNNLGAVHKTLGDNEKALFHFGRAQEVFVAALGHDCLDVAAAYCNMAIVFRQQGKFETALEFYQKDLEITVNILGRDCLDVAKTHNNMGLVYEQQGKYEQALEAYSKSLDIKVKVLGENCPPVAGTHVGLGNVCMEQGDYEKALFHYGKAQEKYAAVYGDRHPLVAGAHLGLGNVREAQWDYEKALFHYGKAQEVYLAVHGDMHLDVAQAHTNMGSVYEQQGKYEQALEAYSKSLDIKVKVLGDTCLDDVQAGRRQDVAATTDVAASYCHVGEVYYHKGLHDKALEFFQKSLDIKIKVVGGVHRDVADMKYNMAGVFEDQGNLQEARKLFLESAEIFAALLGDDHDDTVYTRHRADTVGEEEEEEEGEADNGNTVGAEDECQKEAASTDGQEGEIK